MSLKNLIRENNNLDRKTLAGLAKISSVKESKDLYDYIVFLKKIILRDEFSFSEKDPVANALNKSFYKGADYYLTLLANTIKKSGDILDKLEEDAKPSGSN